MTVPGKHNLITDVAGLRVGNAEDSRLKSGVTAIVCEEPAIAAVHVMGGAPGTRETDMLAAENSVERADAIVLSGGSAFGLDAASGVQAWLRARNRGLEVGGMRVPIVPAAILFDLINGGDKDWGDYPPYRELGFEAAEKAATDFSLGNFGAGMGATTAGLKGGLGSASVVTEDGFTLGALAAVNAIGSPMMGDSRHFWAAPFEAGTEFGGLGLPAVKPENLERVRLKYRDMAPLKASAGANTTIAIIATDAALGKADAKRLAISAHDGFARAIWPSHTPHDGDLVFALSTERKPLPAGTNAFIDLCALASSVMARAIARAVYEASPAPNDLFPTWRERFGE
ncbi:MAG: P1 family peptidase [Nitratireductor sp.]|nr:P1 family peptidase [Nitratireductor sp.]